MRLVLFLIVYNSKLFLIYLDWFWL